MAYKGVKLEVLDAPREAKNCMAKRGGDPNQKALYGTYMDCDNPPKSYLPSVRDESTDFARPTEPRPRDIYADQVGYRDAANAMVQREGKAPAKTDTKRLWDAIKATALGSKRD